MVFKAKDGKSFMNRQKMAAYDERMGMKKKTMPEHQEPDGDEELPANQMGTQEVVEKHGPAHKVVIEHHEGKHVMTSHHQGHTHKTEHGSAEEAHNEGRMAAGVNQDEPDGDEPAAMAPPAEPVIPGM